MRLKTNIDKVTLLSVKSRWVWHIMSFIFNSFLVKFRKDYGKLRLWDYGTTFPVTMG